MKILFEKKRMEAAVAPLMCAVSGKSTLTAIECILMEAKKPNTVTMTTFDLEKGIRLQTAADVIEEGSYIVNAQTFNQYLKSMNEGDIMFEVNDRLAATMSQGKSVQKMGALEATDFPIIPKLESDKSFTISQGKLKAMLNKVMYAMGVNNQRTALNGCYFSVKPDGILLVSCDSYKLAKCSLKTEIINSGIEGTKVDFSFVMPVKTVNELFRMLDEDEDEMLKIYITRKNMVFLFDGVTFFSRLVDELYIDYERIIVKNHKIHLEMDRAALLAALTRASAITEQRIAGSVRSSVKLETAGNILKVMAASSLGSAYDEVDILHEGEDLLIAFNNRYLMDSVRACTADRVRISMSSALTGINIEPAYEREGIEEKFMLLPVRMNH